MSNSMGNVASNQGISHAFYTYAHYNKADNKIFYIGKGKKNRYKSIHRRSVYWNGVANKYGFEPKILAYWNTEKEAFEHEKVLIACFKDMGYKLVNLTDGGEGSAGIIRTERQKELQRAKMKGRPSKTKGTENGMCDLRIYGFQHTTDSVEYCTKVELYTNYNLCKVNVHSLFGVNPRQ